MRYHSLQSDLLLCCVTKAILVKVTKALLVTKSLGHFLSLFNFTYTSSFLKPALSLTSSAQHSPGFPSIAPTVLLQALLLLLYFETKTYTSLSSSSHTLSQTYTISDLAMASMILPQMTSKTLFSAQTFSMSFKPINLLIDVLPCHNGKLFHSKCQ